MEFSKNHNYCQLISTVANYYVCFVADPDAD